MGGGAEVLNRGLEGGYWVTYIGVGRSEFDEVVKRVWRRRWKDGRGMGLGVEDC